MSLSKDERGVSEIVGALLLVVVVSSAVVGFGMFLSQQAKLTQEQKAAELDRQLEHLELGSVLPLADGFHGTCTPIAVPDDSWHSLAFRVTSLHLRESTLTAFRVNDLVVRHAAVATPARSIGDAVTNTGPGTDDLVDSPGGHFVAEDLGRYIKVGSTLPEYTTIVEVIDATQVRVAFPATAPATGATLGDRTFDLSLGPGDEGFRELVVPARQSITVRLENVAMDETDCDPGTAPAFSLFGGAPLPTSSGPLKVTDAIKAEFSTERSNTVERAFIPPSAIATLEPTPGVANSYTLVGTRSLPGSDGAYVVKWTWKVVEEADASGTADCGDAATVSPNPTGHLVQITTAAASNYCVRLTVTDNNGLSASTEFSFDP